MSARASAAHNIGRSLFEFAVLVFTSGVAIAASWFGRAAGWW